MSGAIAANASTILEDVYAANRLAVEAIGRGDYQGAFYGLQEAVKTMTLQGQAANDQEGEESSSSSSMPCMAIRPLFSSNKLWGIKGSFVQCSFPHAFMMTPIREGSTCLHYKIALAVATFNTALACHLQACQDADRKRANLLLFGASRLYSTAFDLVGDYKEEPHEFVSQVNLAICSNMANITSSMSGNHNPGSNTEYWKERFGNILCDMTRNDDGSCPLVKYFVRVRGVHLVS